MKSPNSPYISYPNYPLAYVDRARKQLQLFDEGIPDSLFYAVLELRMGIEARFLEILRVLLRDNNKPAEKIKDYRPRELLEKISKLDENALQRSTLIFGIPGTQNRAVFQFIPVTPELASDYGKVSNVLHWTFFESNKDWYAKRSIVYPEN